MDCEKFESTLLDELYGELDEVTSAAAKRHANGCARCTALFSGLKATRRVAVLPIVEPPADLEERILRAAREAQKVVPMRGRVSRMVSLAGSWAMRPQTAMAALFLIMIGTSTLFLKGKSKAPSSAVTVSDQGEPVASVAMPPLAHPMETENAHAEAKTATASAASAAPTASPSPSTVAMNDSMLDGLSRGGGPAGRAATRPYAVAPPNALRDLSGDDKALNGGNVAGAPQGHGALSGYSAYGDNNAPATAPAPPSMQPAKPSAKDDSSLGGVQQAWAGGATSPSGGGGGQGAAQQQAPSAFDAAKTAFDTGDFVNARNQFDTVFQATSDPNAETYAARSEMMANGCTQGAISRFETVIASAPASRAGYDAKLYEAQCYQSMGDNDDARTRLVQLLTVPSHQQRARNAIDAMGKGGGGGAAKAARAAPAPKPQQQQQQQQQQAPAASPPPVAPNATTNAY